MATPEELLKFPPPPLPRWAREPWQTDYAGNRIALLPTPEYQIQFLKPASKAGKPGEAYFVSSYGPQTWMLMSPFDETVAGGSRGGGKSAGLIAWFAMGDPTLAADDPARYSFLLEPSYRGLMLRKEYQSLAEFVDEAMDFYGPLGGKPKDDPVIFTFKSGAKIYTNHLGDKNAFEKYRGQGITRIGIEELTQIEQEAWYIKLFGSLRAKKQVRVHGRRQFKALHSQIMSTTNPDGPGAMWVRKRFVTVYDGKGNLVNWNSPMRDTFTGLSRIFIPMPRKDNPYLRDNKQYEGMLLAQDETTRRQWMLGEWGVASGQFFKEFRPKGPVTAEEIQKYPWAKHVIEEAELKSWWYRWGGCDVGFDHPAAFHKLCRSEKDGRIHIYDEMSVRGMGSFELGVRAAQWWLPDLEALPDKTVTISLSPEAFSKTDSGRTKAEQMAEGIKSVLGPYGAFLMKYTDDERKMMEEDPQLAAQMFNRRRSEQPTGAMSIVLKPASKDRSGGFSFMRELLRFRPVVAETEDQLKERLMETFNRSGVEAYERELMKVKRPVDEVLPKLQIWDKCLGLIRCMEELMQDEKNTEDAKKNNAIDGMGGDDECDSARYALRDFRDIEKSMPKSYYVSERMENIQSAYEQNTGERIEDPNRLLQIRLTQESRFERTHVVQSSFSLPRASSSRHRVPHGNRVQ